MMYPLYDVTYTMLQIASKLGMPLNVYRLQYALWLLHIDRLVQGKSPIFHATFEAWEYGPAIPSLAYEYIQFGNEPISIPEGLYSPYIESGDRAGIEDTVKFVSEKHINTLYDMCASDNKAWILTRMKCMRGERASLEIMDEDITRELKAIV